MTEGDPVLTVAEIATRLKCSELTVRRWLRSGQLKGVMLGGKKLGYRVRESDLRAFIEAIESKRAA